VIRSMTGYGRAELVLGSSAFEVEVRSVNHRYLDVRARLPRSLSEWETQVKTQMQRRLGRGKVDLSVSPAAGGGAGAVPEIDGEIAARYLAAADELAARHGVPGRMDVTALLGLPGVVRTAEPALAAEVLERELPAAVDRALEALDAMRTREGESLARDLRGRLARVRELGESIAARSGEVQEAVRDRLRKRAESLRQETGLLDEARLHQEIVLAADRLDVTEEVVRLRSHVAQFEAILDEASVERPVGRRLDFLLQEMGRESNTIGSKSADAPVAHQVVELKTELERLREQVQNVE